MTQHMQTDADSTSARAPADTTGPARTGGHGWRHWLAEEWAPVLFGVGLITVLHHAGPLAPVSRLSLLALSSFQAELAGGAAADSTARTWLLSIDEHDFLTSYQERRPLSRGQLAKDIHKILEGRPAVLAVDLDLSPLVKPDESEEADQRKLDALLDGKNPVANKPPYTTQIRVIRPFAADDAGLREKKSQWMQARRNVGFATDDIDVVPGMNVAIEFECRAAGLAEQALAASAGAPCKPGRAHLQPLDFATFQRTVFSQSISLFNAAPDQLRRKTVFFGSRTGRADRVLTPLGEGHGVVVHAARFATLAAGGAPLKGVDLLIDLAMASIFSWQISRFMPRYLERACERSVLTPPRLALLLGSFALRYLLTVAAALAIAFVLAWHGVFIEPLLIAIGLAFDGFVVAGWQHLGEPATRPGTPPAPADSWLVRFAAMWQAHAGLAGIELLRWVIFWGVVLGALASTVL